MARRRLILNPFEWLMLGGLFVGLVYGVVTWSSSRTNCTDPPGGLSIRYGGGDTAYLYGLLTSQSACKLRALAREHPAVENLVLVDIPVVPALTVTVTLVVVVDPIIMDRTNQMRQEHAKGMDWSRSQHV